MHDYVKELSQEVTIERAADCGIILEKSYTIDFAYEVLEQLEGITDLIKILNPIWGEHILYFNYRDKKYVIVSAKGASIAANAVERIRRTGGKGIISIGTCGSTDESIEDGTFIVASAGVRNEGASTGYLGLKVPALSTPALTNAIAEKLYEKGIPYEIGLIFTTDNRYQEDPVELRMLNKHANVKGVDMETSAVLLIATFHQIEVSTIKIVTDCAVKDTKGELKGVFDRNKDFITFVHPKLKDALIVALNVLGERDL